MTINSSDIGGKKTGHQSLQETRSYIGFGSVAGLRPDRAQVEKFFLS